MIRSELLQKYTINLSTSDDLLYKSERVSKNNLGVSVNNEFSSDPR